MSIVRKISRDVDHQKQILYDMETMPYQGQFQNSTKPKVYLSGGYGSGKTYSLVMKMFWLMDQNRGLAGGILCPTTKMYKRDVYPTIVEICRENGIRYKYNKSDLVWFFPDAGATVYVFHGEDDGASIRGPNLAWGLINEVTICTEKTFKAFLARVRQKRARFLQVAMSGTPEEFNWAYEYFIENPREDTELIFGNSRQNVYNHEDYIALLEASYDKLMQEQYIDGKYVNLKGGRAAYAFDRQLHTRPDVKRIPGLPVRVSLDFNVAPMAATLWNIVPKGYDGGPMVRAFDEICLQNSNTYELCDALEEKIGRDSDGEFTDEVYVYPDPAGRARSTKSRNTSDFDILKEAGFTDLRYHSTISVRDCLNALNNMFDKDEVVLNSKKCRQTIADYEQCVLKKDVFEIDKKNLKRSHWLDGSKNFIQYEFPVKKRTGFRTERTR